VTSTFSLFPLCCYFEDEAYNERDEKREQQREEEEERERARSKGKRVLHQNAMTR
jgi:hypothetical protein